MPRFVIVVSDSEALALPVSGDRPTGVDCQIMPFAVFLNPERSAEQRQGQATLNVGTAKSLGYTCLPRR